MGLLIIHRVLMFADTLLSWRSLAPVGGGFSFPPFFIQSLSPRPRGFLSETPRFLGTYQLSVYMLFLLITLSQCRQQETSAAMEGMLSYEPTSGESGSLTADAKLNGSVKLQQLALALKISNNGTEDFLIREIVISTPEGLRSSPINVQVQNFVLSASADTLVQLIFRPVNDLALYQLTGINGSLKSAYYVLVTYALKDEDDERTLTLALSLPEHEYRAQEAVKNKENILVYSFNTGDDFASRQSAHLSKALNSNSSFIHVTEQEMLMAGLNIRVKAYKYVDSLYVSLIFINHAEFSLMLDKAAMNLHSDGMEDGHDIVGLQKITGSTQATAVLQRGERIAVNLKKYVGDRDAAEFFISMQKSVFLEGGTPIFAEDIKLVESGVF